MSKLKFVFSDIFIISSAFDNDPFWIFVLIKKIKKHYKISINTREKSFNLNILYINTKFLYISRPQVENTDYSRAWIYPQSMYSISFLKP